MIFHSKINGAYESDNTGQLIPDSYCFLHFFLNFRGDQV